MQERYLFRGKRIEDGEWLEGSLCKSEGWLFIVYDHDFYETTKFGKDTLRADRYAEVDPATIGKSSGLRDKSGSIESIYEGDIVRYAGKYMYVVCYGIWNKNPANCAPAYVVGWYLSGIGEMAGDIDALYEEDGYALRYPAHVVDTPAGVEGLRLEVIGNVHDDPELLEVAT